MRQNVLIGTAGWRYHDWNGIVYPGCRPTGFHELEYLAQYLPLVEVNQSFEHPVRPESAEFWLERLRGARDFTVTAKLYRAFTHERRWSSADIRAVHAGLTPLHEARRLGALLMQFPSTFRWSHENAAHVRQVVKLFRRYPLVAEFRHASWNRVEPLEQLAHAGVGFCNVDQPQLGHAMPPTEIVTADVAYVRLHGRNYEGWYGLGGEPGPRAARYDYGYSHRQLAAWTERIATLSAQAKRVFVVTNNPAQGKAVLNALQLRQMVTGMAVPVPEPLAEAYPEAYELAAARKAPARVLEMASTTARRLAS